MKQTTKSNISMQMARDFESKTGKFMEHEIHCSYYPDHSKKMSKKAGNGYKQYVHQK